MFTSLLITLFTHLSLARSLTLYAPFDAIGVRGNITFEQPNPSSSVTVSVHLTAAASVRVDAVRHFEWSIHEFPVFLDVRGACAATELGKSEHDLWRRHALIRVPATQAQTFVDSELSLWGARAVWSKSLLLKSVNGSEQRACANIAGDGPLRSAMATFALNNMAGTVLFRENDRSQTMIFSNLFHTADEYRSASRHEWKIVVADILDTREERKCESLQILFDPNHVNDTLCSATNHSACKMGDLSRKHGAVTVGAANNRYSKKMVIDTNLGLSEGSRALYLTLFDAKRVFACAAIVELAAKEVRAVFDMHGVKGSVRFSQSYRTDPTVVTVSLEQLRGRAKWYHVHHFPVPTARSKLDHLCSAEAVGMRFNPFGVDAASGPAAGAGTCDQYEVGDLSGKYGALSEDQDLQRFDASYVDLNLPLFGPHSIVGRSVVVHKADGERWLCASIGYAAPVVTAIATFVYPVVGRVTLRQDRSNSWSDTSALVELDHSDGSLNRTHGHTWSVHVHEPGRDFYNWSSRCASAGQQFNPFGVGSGRLYGSQCSPENALRCRVGDLTAKSGRLTVGDKLFYTDVMLPLSGPFSVIGRSIVIGDDSAPKQRGNRMACALIRETHAVTAAVRTWTSGSHVGSNVSGSVVFFQSTPFDTTEVKLDLRGLDGLASGYHVHQAWVPTDKEFPCAADSVYGYFNPLQIDDAVGPSPKIGSVDQYAVGDLSGKFGLLDDKQSERSDWLDSNLPLFGPNSIVGRSVVIRKRDKNFGWLCGTIRAERPKKSGREVVGFASFDDPRHLVSGYVRLKQFEFADGSTSDTTIELELRHPGLNNRNVTNGHEWSIFVNQVGADAFNAVDSVRCLAAGYLWNPFLSDDRRVHCNASQPLRCAVGDLSGRLGSLTVGAQRLVLSDPHLPLTGNFSVMGRSVVLFAKKGSRVPMACANIRPDVHIHSNVAVKKTGSFTVANFMTSIRAALNTTDWLVVADLQRTQHVLDGQCVQIAVNFYGEAAQRLQSEFNNLVNFGTIARHTRTGLQTVSTFYKPCRTLHELEGLSSVSTLSFSPLLSAISFVTFVINFICC